MGAGFLGPLFGSAVLKEHQRADEFIAILRRVVERQLGFVGIGKGQHGEASLLVPRTSCPGA